MNEETSSDDTNDFLKDNDIELTRIHIMLKQVHIKLLDSIDDANTSNAIRIVLNDYIRYKKVMGFEKYLMIFAYGMMLVGMGVILPNIYVSICCFGTGLFLIGFGIYKYYAGRVRYEAKEKKL